MIQPSYDIVVVTADLDSLINKLFFPILLPLDSVLYSVWKKKGTFWEYWAKFAVRKNLEMISLDTDLCMQQTTANSWKGGEGKEQTELRYCRLTQCSTWETDHRSKPCSLAHCSNRFFSLRSLNLHLKLISNTAHRLSLCERKDNFW